MQKNIVKIARRIEFASIYPPNAMNEMQNAIIEFDNVQKSEQGGLRFVDMFLFLRELLYQVERVALNKVQVDGYLNHQIH